MREIKFRAWHNKFERYLIDSEWHHYGTTLHQGVLSSDNHIIEQFTGLHDKNGKEIYEGDIVRVGDYDEGMWLDDSIHAINYQASEGYPAFELTPHPGHEMNGLAYVFQSGEQDIEVIGTIHENPDLLTRITA